MTDIAAAAIRIASSGAMTVRGVILRMPYPRQEATETVQRMIADGEFVLRDDGVIAVGKSSGKKIGTPRKAYRRIARAKIIAELARNPQSADDLARALHRKKHGIHQHLAQMMADGEVLVLGYDKRPGIRGIASRIYSIPSATTHQ